MRKAKIFWNIVLAASVGVFLSAAMLYAEDKPQYVPNEIIIKLRAETPDTPATSLDKLNKKHKVKKFDQIFKDFKKDQKKLEALKSKKEKDLNEKEKHILKRLKRAPKDAKSPNLDRIYKLTLEEGQSVEEAVAEYKKNPNVEYAQLNYIYQLCVAPLPQEPYIPNDYYIENNQNPGYWRERSWGQSYPDLYGLQKIRAIEAWNAASSTYESVVVAVIDSGVDYNHEDLQRNVWNNEGEIPDNGIDDDQNGYIDDIRGYDMSDGDNDPLDYHGHGTHVGGIIAAAGNNAIGIAGVAYGAKIMPVKIFPEATSAVCAQGIRYAAYNGADILSNSWGPQSRQPQDPTIEAAIDDAYAKGCVIIFAAGNSSDDVAYYSPANYSKTIAVAATDYLDQRASFSNWGSKIDVSAPGVEVLSLRANGTDMYNNGLHIVDNYYYRSNGTSMACPYVSGLAAVILSLQPHLGVEEVRQIIRNSADDLGSAGFDIFFGYGRINIYKAVLQSANSDARIFFDRAVYPAPSAPLTEVIIGLFDTDLDQDTVLIQIWSMTEAYPESVLMREVAPGAGIFRGSIFIAPVPTATEGDGILQVQHNDIITARYIETSPQAVKEATAAVDAQPPAISSVEVSSLDLRLDGGGVAVIAWHTDEPSTSRVYYGKTTDYVLSKIAEGLTTDHCVTLDQGITGGVTYYFAVESSDKAGNLSSANMDGSSYYTFYIKQPIIEVSPTSFNFTIPEKSGPFQDTITISNTGEAGSADLLFAINESPAGKWLSVSTREGRIGQSSSMPIQLNINPVNLSAGEYHGEIHILNNAPSQETIIPVTLVATPRPVVRSLAYQIIDDWSGRSLFGNGDKRLNPGERVEVQFEVKNYGSLPALGLSAFLNTNDSYVSILDDEIALGDLAPGIRTVVLDTFLIEASSNTPADHIAAFTLSITDSAGYLWQEELQLVVISPFDGVQGDDMRINTNMPATATQSYHQICSDNNGHVYVVWQDNRNVPDRKADPFSYDIYFNYSLDFGATWHESDIRLNTEAPGTIPSYYPKMCSDEKGHIYVVWGGGFNYSADYGATWQMPDTTMSVTSEPAVSCDNDGNVYMVWSDYRSGMSDIYFRHSADYGATWSGDVRLDTSAPGSSVSARPKISSDNNGNVYVVWIDGRNQQIAAGWDIYFNYSTDNGATWLQDYGKSDIRLDRDEAGSSSSDYPQICSDSDGNVYVVWQDNRNNPSNAADIYFNYSNDGGATWEEQDIRLDTDMPGAARSSWPQISCDADGHTYVVWQDDRNGKADIYFNCSAANGAVWEENDIRLDTDMPGNADSYVPQIAADDNGTTYVVWHDTRNDSDPEDRYGMPDIYLNYSADYGITWQDNDIRINSNEPGSTPSFYPDISCDDTGNAYAAWMDYRNNEIPGSWGNDTYFAHFIKPDKPPTLITITDKVVQENMLLTFGIRAASSEGNPLVLSCNMEGIEDETLRNNIKSNAVFIDNGNGAGRFKWTPGPGTAGEYYPVAFIVKEADTGRSTYQFVKITVTESYVNTPPYFIYPIGDKAAYAGQEINFTIEAEDPDGDPIHFGGSAIPTEADYHDNGDGTAVFSWIPADAGEYMMVFSVYDDYHDYTEITYERVTITVIYPPPVADFTVSAAQGEVPLTVNFTNASTGHISSYLWTFGDGETSTEQNPIHMYNALGTFNVSLRVIGPGGEDTKATTITTTFSGSITGTDVNKKIIPINEQLALRADFTPDKFTSWGWLCDGDEFLNGTVSPGDGGTMAFINMEGYPAYFTPGTHDIQFRATNDALGITRYSEPFPITVLAVMDSSLIQAAINSASAGSTVLVGPGVYVFSSNLNITKNITLKASDPNSDLTILILGSYHIFIKDPTMYNQNEVYYALFQNLNDVTIDGFTIKGYRGQSTEGPIQNYSGSLTLKNCKIIDNEGIRVGAIYSCWQSKLYLENTLIAKNKNLAATSVSPYTFRLGNRCYAGTIYLAGEATLKAANSTIADNINDSQPFVIQGKLNYDGTDGPITINIQYGAVFRKYQNNFSLINSIVWHNGVGIQDFANKDLRQQDVSITYSDTEARSIYQTIYGYTQEYKTLYGNATTADYYKRIYYPLNDTHSDINEDPQFTDPASYSYNISETSPCKGTGLDGTDMGANSGARFE